MKTYFLSFFVVLQAFAFAFTAQETEPKNLAMRAVPFTNVHFNDHFWSPRLKTNREISIPHNYKWCEDTGRFTNFAKAAKLMDGKFQGIYFNDSDVYKLLEGTAYSLADHPDVELKKRADAVIEWIAAAQQPNGYINTYYELVEPDKKWTNTHVMHELYCAGHMTEAAVAYYQATGDRKLLDVTEKFLAHIMDTFGREPGKKVEVPGHEEIELALVKLYQLTGDEKYLDLSQFFIDVRGDQAVRTDKLQGAYSQDHKPVRKQDEIMGHAVRAMYLYAGVADVAAYTGDKELINAMNTLWNDVVNQKMYITGGIGARHEGEAFGEAFELPNNSAYCETCAAIGLVLWAHRLNLMHGDAKYADIVERAIYNGVLSGIGMDGKSFFYVNPLASGGNHHRQPFYDCACCPTNVVRFVPSLPGYQYAIDDDGIIVNQYIAGESEIDHPKFGKMKLKMETNYPWDAGWFLRIAAEKPVEGFKLKYRTRESANDPIPSKSDSVTVFVDGKEVITPEDEKDVYANGYATKVIKGPEHDFGFGINAELTPYRVLANPKVTADRGRVAIMRGPLVYCFEQCDNEVPVDRIVLAKNPEFQYEFKKDLLGGIGVITCKNADGRKLTAVPYFAWDTREPGKMEVWVRQEGLSKKFQNLDITGWVNEKTGEPILYRNLTPEMLNQPNEQLTLMEKAIPSASHCWGNDTVDSLCEENEPKNSDDHSIPRLTFWNHKGTQEWIEYRFDKPEMLSKTSIYWFDDEPRGECRLPHSWKMFYRKGNDWVPVETTSKFGTEKDKWNSVEFTPVETNGLRIEIQLQNAFSAGVLGWKVE
ncbi:MAG: glycoside hydrolase family 127 protein [Thermoguttaceae bacterium]